MKALKYKNNCNKMVMLKNICYVLDNFLNNSQFDNIVFSWVLHKQEDHNISSKATEFNAFYDADSINKAVVGSLNKLKQIIKLDTIKIDVSEMTQEQVLNKVIEIVGLNKKMREFI